MSATISISSVSTEYIQVPVSAVKSGSQYNPTSDVVQFAFLQNLTGTPGMSDWVAGTWDITQNSLYPYIAQCLIGPSGAKTLKAGEYTVWVKVTDNPETPVRQVGNLIIF